MTNGENNNLASERKLTTRDYTLDGIIGMWDGIENIGVYRHSNDALIWKDLVGNSDMQLVQNPSYAKVWFENNCCVKENAETVNLGYIVLNDIGTTFQTHMNNAQSFTIEMHAIKQNDSIRDADYWLIDANQQFQFQSYRTNSLITVYINTNQSPASVSLNTLSRFTISMVCFKNRNVDVYLNGVYQKTLEEPLWINNFGNLRVNQRGGERRYFNIRAYNRMLTADEIKHNYEVDKVRFGL